MAEGSAPTNVASIDWEKCILFQKFSSEKVRCPVDTNNDEVETWYSNLYLNIEEFHEIGCMPMQIDLVTTIDKNGDLAKLFMKNHAKWHKSCRDQFSNLKLVRAKKRKAD